MQVRKKELGQDIIVSFDYKNYNLFLDKLKQVAKECEFNSNLNKLDYSIVFNCRKTPKMDVCGWSSRVITKAGGIQEVVYIDYDDILFRLVETELKFIQEKYNLSPFYVFKTFETIDKNGEFYGNYVCICITKKYFGELVEILSKLHCDRAYKIVPTSYPYKTWVLRLGKKGKKSAPQFKCIVGDITKEYNQDVSQGHLEIIEKLYPETKDKIKYTNLDNNHELYLSNYKTASK